MDDEPAVTDATRMLLEPEGFEVLTAASLNDALKCASGQALDLLITDYHLRGGSTGLDVIHAVRERIRRDLPIIVVSGDTSDRISLVDVEQMTFLTKPVDVDELLIEIRRQIGSS